MNSTLEDLFERSYRSLLRVYPADFRERFTLEMVQVYRSLARQTYKDSGLIGLLLLWLRTILDGVFGALQQWRQHFSKRRTVSMNANLVDKSDGTVPLTLRQTAAAVTPFLLFGLASIASKLEAFRTMPANLSLWQVIFIHPYLVFNWLILLGLAAGIITGFPRWAFSYLGWALMFAWWWTGMGFYGYSWEYQIWLPLGVTVGASLIIHRSIKPVKVILTSLWRDLTLLSLGVYILYTSMFLIADENHNPYLPLFITASSLVACLGAWGFFRSTSPLRRVLSLIGGLALTIPISILNSLTWDYRAYYGLPEGSPLEISPIGMLIFVFLAGIMLGLAWLTQRRIQHKHPT